MEYLAVLPLGFVVGMAHAVEADHLAAMAALTGREGGRRAMIARGAFWGLGHTLSLFAICSVVVFLGLTISGTVESALELAVGAMILALGGQVLWRLRRERMHLHPHSHGTRRHIHVHSHAGEAAPHKAGGHPHPHPAGRGHGKAVAVGLMHGAAGSAGLLVLMVAATNGAGALIYFAVFGLGSLCGMAALTAVASYPLALVHRGAAGMRNAVTGAIGAAALWVGGGLVIASLGALT